MTTSNIVDNSIREKNKQYYERNLGNISKHLIKGERKKWKQTELLWKRQKML